MESDIRPTSKTQLPFRVLDTVPIVRLEYYQANGSPCSIPVEPSPFADQKGVLILKMMQLFWELEAQVDGWRAELEKWEIESAFQKREIEKLGNQLAEAKRQQKKNGN